MAEQKKPVNLGPGKKTGNVRFDYAKLDVKGLKGVCDEFKKNGCPVAVSQADNKPRRESGIQIKRFELEFEDGQKAMVRVKQDGTAYQVRLNNRVVPIKAVDDLKKAIKEICDAWYDNAQQYAKAKRAREKRLARQAAGKERKPAVKSTRRERIAKAKEDLAQVEQDIADLEIRRDELQKKRGALQSTISSISQELEAEKKRFAALTAEYQDLKAQVEKLAA